MGKKRVAIVGTGQTHHKSHRPDVSGQELIQRSGSAGFGGCRTHHSGY